MKKNRNERKTLNGIVGHNRQEGIVVANCHMFLYQQTTFRNLSGLACVKENQICQQQQGGEEAENVT